MLPTSPAYAEVGRRTNARRAWLRLLVRHAIHPGFLEGRVPLLGDRLARAAGQLGVEMQVVEREEAEDEDFACKIQVTQVRARVAARAAGARALRVDGELV